MNFETLFVNPAGATPKAQYIGAAIVLLAVAAFYYFLVFGRTGQFALLMLLYPALVLHARRLRAMGQNAWLVFIPGSLLAAMAWIKLYPFAGAPASIVTWAALGMSALFVLWSVAGKDVAPA